MPKSDFLCHHGKELGCVIKRLVALLHKHDRHRGLSLKRTTLLTWLLRRSIEQLADGDLVIYPGHQNMRDKSRLSRRALINAERWLTNDLGIWTVVGGGRGQGHAKELRLNIKVLMDFLSDLNISNKDRVRLSQIIFSAKETGGFGIIKPADKRCSLTSMKGAVTAPRFIDRNLSYSQSGTDVCGVIDQTDHPDAPDRSNVVRFPEPGCDDGRPIPPLDAYENDFQDIAKSAKESF